MSASTIDGTTKDQSQTNPSSTTTVGSKPKRTITVLYFAAALTATGVQSEVIDIDLPFPSVSGHSPNANTAVDGEGKKGFPLSKLGDVLIQRHAGSNLDEVLKTSQWSVDAEMVDDPESVFLKGGEEVAVICPVSGG